MNYLNKIFINYLTLVMGELLKQYKIIMEWNSSVLQYCKTWTLHGHIYFISVTSQGYMYF